MNNYQKADASNTNSRRVLHSSKEISSYVGRGVRTVQRYEVELGFPIHRLTGSQRSAVLGFSDEIDQWLAKSPTRQDSKVGTTSLDRCKSVHDKAKLSIDQANSLRARIEETRLLIDKLSASVARNQMRRQRMRQQAQTA